MRWIGSNRQRRMRQLAGGECSFGCGRDFAFTLFKHAERMPEGESLGHLDQWACEVTGARDGSALLCRFRHCTRS